jgi:hypothetical protein
MRGDCSHFALPRVASACAEANGRWQTVTVKWPAASQTDCSIGEAARAAMATVNEHSGMRTVALYAAGFMPEAVCPARGPS